MMELFESDYDNNCIITLNLSTVKLYYTRHYQISRIRSFYMRKVKFTEANLNEKLTGILGEFPKIEVLYHWY